MKDMNIQSWVIDKLKDAEIEVISDKEEFKRILENEKLLHKMEIIENANKQDMIEEPKLSTEIINNNDDARNIALTTNDKQLLTKALSETAIPLVETVYSRENYMRIFRDGIIESPVETIKMGINQFIKLCPPNRNYTMASIYETLTKPSVIFESLTLDEKDEELKPIHVYGKSFINKDDNLMGIKSVLIFRNDEKIVITAHPRPIEDIIENIKTTNDIIYLDNEVSRVATFNLNAGDSHAWFNQKTKRINPKYNEDKILSINKMIESGEIQAGQLEITKDNFDKYYNLFNQHNRYKDKKDVIASTLFYCYVNESNKEEMKNWLVEQGYEIDSKKVSKMQLQDGTTYGFTHNGKIYLNPDITNSATPIHEYTHLWDNYIQNTNKELWNKGLAAFKDTTIWKEVINDPHYADIKDDENLVLSECHARITGSAIRYLLSNNQIIKEERPQTLQEKFLLSKLTETGIKIISNKQEFDRILEEKNKNLQLQEKDIEMNNTNLSPFDKELIAYKNGELGDNHIFNLGKPAGILKECGFPENNRIELSASRLKLKATQGNHIYDFLDIQGLDKALQNPIAVFEYGDKKKSQNVIVNIEKGGKNFLVGVFFNQRQRGYEVSDIRGLFNRTNIDWIRWIEQGKMIYGNKSEIKKVIEKIKNNVQVLTTQQRTNLAEVNSQEARTSSDSYYLNTVINILDKYEKRNDFYTKKFPEYEKECKERYELYRLFKNAYLQTDSVEESDAPIQAAQVYQALKENNKEVIDYYIENDNEISEIVKSLYEANNTNISLLQKESLISKNIENKETNEIIKKLDNEVNRLKKGLDYLCSMNPEELEDIAKEMKVYKDKDLGSRMERKAKSLVAEKQGIKHKQKSRNKGMEY